MHVQNSLVRCRSVKMGTKGENKTCTLKWVCNHKLIAYWRGPARFRGLRLLINMYTSLSAIWIQPYTGCSYVRWQGEGKQRKRLIYLYLYIRAKNVVLEVLWIVLLLEADFQVFFIFGTLLHTMPPLKHGGIFTLPYFGIYSVQHLIERCC